ncbi:Hydrogenase-4 component D [[Actinomadura] parvosata subsp. kistnae]|uniref:Uncharacterized protein n=1 Tax=[Actinomadura] parvosata subsp. kistnae TaxID=1909395 RepID=A0A1U9ZV53_9ACTN|nr:hypothetical protein [Nonomuraea sp. ATCC 55076]AQZ61822.1 hypothetical protein BKM31_10365 [Nonomuraea sp. ATCC 55076]SPL87956.1 Hydrogenase-4 component D [Actinomadura parvosata subsp. kistnae]
MRALTAGSLSLLAVLGVGVAGCGDAGPPRSQGTATLSPAPAPTPPAPDTPVSTTPAPDATGPATEPPASPSASASTGPPGAGESLVAGRYQPLWPFSSPEEVAAWQREYRAGGHQPWHLDARGTAIAFSRDFLGFSGIDRAVKTVTDGAHARVHVGFGAEGVADPPVAAVVHLVRYGSGQDAPWEVVGTDDTTLSLTRPAYGAAVRSPVTVGGRVTGVDESIRIQVRHPGSGSPVGQRCCVSAGGQNAPWSASVTFRRQPGRTLTIVASTGGHVAQVERFAVTGVTSPP